jgi:hypothetical protein
LLVAAAVTGTPAIALAETGPVRTLVIPISASIEPITPEQRTSSSSLE